jgi:hypothetical protein
MAFIQYESKIIPKYKITINVLNKSFLNNQSSYNKSIIEPIFHNNSESK